MQSFRIAFGAFPLVTMLTLVSCSAPAPQRIPSRSEIEAVCGNPFVDFACTDAGRNDRLARFGIPPLQKVRKRKSRKGETGDFIVAVLTTKERSSDFALIFERRNQYGPVVEIRGSTGRDTSQKRYVARLDEAAWHGVVEGGKSFDTRYFSDVVCVGGGAIYSIEAMDGRGKIRARAATPCEGGPVLEYFDRLSTIALQRLRQCAPAPDESEEYEGVASNTILMDCVAGKRRASLRNG